MGLSKTDLFTEEQNRLAILAKSLAHPARIAILQHMLRKESCVCGDIVEEIGLAQATVSQHLKELKSIGLIKGTITGRRACYCIDAEVWKKVQKDLLSIFELNNEQAGFCC
ncbi:MAG: winged helix-turn-helix transcriptional regulator [Eudoraea sp.]|nr:winged helix-turn-helix transcriptional regulator [Eudoraea sp.]NNE28727.1 winged helix-turn-helix transcriptional regulator [Saprospiraceae bacterium]